MSETRLGILISGRGTTMEAMVEACQQGRVIMSASCVISSKDRVPGIDRALKLGFVRGENLFVVEPAKYGPINTRDNIGFGEELIENLTSCGVTVVHQAGWIPWTPENVIDRFRDSIYMEHPGPIPEFGGRKMSGRAVHQAVLLFKAMTGGEPYTKVIAQRVGVEYDGGTLVGERSVPFQAGDTAEAIELKGLPYEHALQIQLLEDIASCSVKTVEPEPFIRPGQEKYLELAKQAAIIRYPNG